MKQTIRLTESDLHKIIKESVNNILKEVHSKFKPIDKRRLSMEYTPLGVVGLFISEDAYDSENPIIVELGDNVDDLRTKVANLGGGTVTCQGMFALTEEGQSLVLRGNPIYGIEYPQENSQSRVNLWNFLEREEKNGSWHYAVRIY